jgi:imidazolonepropionase-like amidohydrolase
MGSVERGKLADLVAVVGDPTQDVRVLLSPAVVIKGGEIYTISD